MINNKRLLLIVSFLLFIAGVFLLYGMCQDELPTKYTVVGNERELNKQIAICPSNAFVTEDLEIIITQENGSRAQDPIIYYTLDGSIPTLESSVYTQPILINVSKDLQVIVIRASVLQKGILSEPITKTYFVGQNVDTRFSTQVVSLVTDNENLYDYEKGILIGGKLYDEWIEEGGEFNANYYQRTSEWERAAHVEVFTKEGVELVNVDVNISTAGNMSSQYPIKSINIKSKEGIGDENHFLNFVELEDSIQTEAFSIVGEKTNSVRLRNSGNDFYSTLIRQNVCNEIARQSGLRTVSAISPVVVYINGEYYSLLQAQNNFSSSNLGKMFSLETDYIDVIGEAEQTVFKEIDNQIDFRTADFNDSTIRKEFEKIVDIDEFFLYYAIEILLGNYDWLINNYRVIRYTGEPIEGNSYSEGKIHFLFFDTDHAFDLNPDYMDIFEILFDSRLDKEEKGVHTSY